MSKQDEWLERLVKNYSIPTEEKKEKRGVLNEEQLKNLKNGKSGLISTKDTTTSWSKCDLC